MTVNKTNNGTIEVNGKTDPVFRQETDAVHKADLPSAFAYPSGGWALYDAFESDQAREAYNQSLGGLERKDYDPQGFLKMLGAPDRLGAPGRTDADLYKAFNGARHFSPGTSYLPKPSWFSAIVQSTLFFFTRMWTGVGVIFSKCFNIFIHTNKSLPMYGDEVLPGPKKVDPRSPTERYIGVNRTDRDDKDQCAFNDDFHGGSIARDGIKGLGTYDIACDIGFNEEQAKRIADADLDVDYDTTPYKDQHGKTRITQSQPGGDVNWHFNGAAKGQEDTRYVAAGIHLERALAAARKHQYDTAEIELGIGLHSLQDSFAHGQITPVTHGLESIFPDFKDHMPVNDYEAQELTELYLRYYLDKIGAFARQTTTTPAVLPTASPLPISTVFILADLPEEMRDTFTNAGLKFYLTGSGVRPTQLGFGHDLNHDGVIDHSASDVDGDGVIESYEHEDRRAAGRSWDDIPAGYDVARKIGFVSSQLVSDRKAGPKLRHELMHAWIGEKMAEPNGPTAQALKNTFQQARDRSDLGIALPSLQEYFAERFAAMNNTELSIAIARLATGQALE